MTWFLVAILAAFSADAENMQPAIDLGTRHLAAGETAEAVAVFSELARRNPRSALAGRNLACALYAARRYAEAERAARHAVLLEPLNPRGRYLLGLSLVAQERFSAEALENLRAAARDIPEAYLPAAIVLIARGAFEDAQRYLAAFTRAGVSPRAAPPPENVREIPVSPTAASATHKGL